MERNRDNSVFSSIAQRIWQVRQSTPGKLAIVTDCRQVTFDELVSEASSLSESISGGLERTGDSVIAIATNDSLHMVIGALAAWRAGCAYLPIDPTAPEQRTRHMLTEAGVQVVISDLETNSGLPEGDWKQVPFHNDLSNDRTPSPREENGWEACPGDLAYVIYTSGSTGQPKGVAVTHANLRHLSDWHQRSFQVTPEDRGMQFGALTFDASVVDTWPLLGAGATLFMVERSIALAPIRIRDFIVGHGITICGAITPVAEQLMSLDWPQETQLRFLLVGGDKLRMFAPAELPFRVINSYGPTECTVLATSGIVPVRSAGNGEPTIGPAIPGNEVYVLDSNLQRVPDGEYGQLAIAGASVSAGYINRPDLTQERFIQSPWLPDSRTYLTGDIGRKLPSGEFEFYGRLDDQIKIRGYRIEPGEIVSALRAHPSIVAAAVKSVGIHGSPQLIAYVVLRDDVSASDMRAYLLSRVPTYMLPDQFVRLAELPITKNCKVDVAALPVPDKFNSLEPADPLIELESEIQEEVAGIFGSLLGGRKISAQENFFRVGGHSLLAAQVIARIQKVFGIDLPLRTVFESPTVAELSAQIEARIVESFVSVSASSEPAT